MCSIDVAEIICLIELLSPYLNMHIVCQKIIKNVLANVDKFLLNLPNTSITIDLHRIEPQPA